MSLSGTYSDLEAESSGIMSCAFPKNTRCAASTSAAGRPGKVGDSSSHAQVNSGTALP